MGCCPAKWYRQGEWGVYFDASHGPQFVRWIPCNRQVALRFCTWISSAFLKALSFKRMVFIFRSKSEVERGGQKKRWFIYEFLVATTYIFRCHTVLYVRWTWFFFFFLNLFPVLASWLLVSFMGVKNGPIVTFRFPLPLMHWVPFVVPQTVEALAVTWWQGCWCSLRSHQVKRSPETQDSGPLGIS